MRVSLSSCLLPRNPPKGAKRFELRVGRIQGNRVTQSKLVVLQDQFRGAFVSWSCLLTSFYDQFLNIFFNSSSHEIIL